MIGDNCPADELIEIIEGIRDMNNHKVRAYLGEYPMKFLPSYKKVVAKIQNFKTCVKSYITKKYNHYEAKGNPKDFPEEESSEFRDLIDKLAEHRWRN